jgi:hypothetical protein
MKKAVLAITTVAMLVLAMPFAVFADPKSPPKRNLPPPVTCTALEAPTYLGE